MAPGYDYSFGPASQYRTLDFTLRFSNIFLSFVPAVFLIALAIPRVYRLQAKSRRLLPLSELPVVGIITLLVKAAFPLGLLGCTIGICVTWQSSDGLRGEWSGLAAGVAQITASFVLSAIVLLEHFRSARPSQLPALYLIVTALLEASRLRTLCLLGPSSDKVIPALAACLAFRLSSFLVLQISTRSSLRDGASLPPAATAGLVSRYFLTWVMPVLIRGFRKPLNMDQLGAIDGQLHSLATWKAFEPEWKTEVQRHHDGKTKQPLARACLRAFLGVLTAPILPSLIYSVTSMARPLIILHTVQFVQSHSTANPQILADGWGLVGGAFLIYMVYSLALALGHVATQRSALALRGALMEALYRKSLLITVDSAREMGSAKATNLMSVDIASIVRTVPAIHYAWTALVETGLGLYIIWTQIGLSFLATVGGAIVFFAVLGPLSKHIGTTRTTWASATDGRVRFMSSVFRHIKAIKLSAYEPIIARKAEGLRETELTAFIAWVKEILKVSITTNWNGNFLALITVIVFTVVSIYSSGGGNSVTTAKIFTVVSTVTLISSPLLMLGQQLGAIVSAWASFKRIEQFLLLKERTESNPSTVPTQSESGSSSLELGPLDGIGRNCKIELVNATFGVTNKVNLVHDLNVKLDNPRLWMIVGEVGCGKSSLIQALIGESDLIAGSSDIQLGTVGLCTQDSWLRADASIRENITFMQPYDVTWYRTIIRSLALEVDLESMVDGDHTIVSSLSGGQKQRVALARAVYGRFQTLVLDDVFSALDADTEAHVFTSLFGAQGLLKDTTVILATNQVYRLPYSSWITVLENGRAVEQGEYTELMLVDDGAVARLIREHAAGAEDKASKSKQESSSGTRDALSEVERVDSHVSSSLVEREESRARGKVAWSTYKTYLRGMGTSRSIQWVTMVVVTSAVQTSISIYLQGWTTKLPGSPRSQYGVFLAGYAGIQLGYLLAFTGAITVCFVTAHPAASRRLHRWQLHGVLGTSLKFFENRGVGEMVNRFNSDLNTIDMELPNAAVNFMFAATQIIGGAILMTIAGPYMAAVLVLTGALMFALQRFYVKAARELRRLDLTSLSPIYTLFSETIDTDGLCTIRAMQAQDVCRRLNTQHATASQHPAWLLMAVQKWLELVLNLCVALVNTLLVLIAVLTRNTIAAGILAVALTEASNMNNWISHLIVEWTRVEMSITSVERVEEYIKLPPQESRSKSKLTFDPEWLSMGSLRFQNVTARYQPELPPALKDISFIVKPGQRVGICGRSGSGKSTLLGVLWRLIDIDEGHGGIFIDGADIREIPLHMYRSAMSIIPQDPLLLETTLRENLDPEGDKTDMDMWSALEQAQLKSYIETMPNKLDEMITGEGGNFSRGQRQLLALARAILRQRRILALDEATSSIDVNTDAAIQRTIREAFDNCTVLTIAHRISTVIDYDMIVMMDAGRIVEMGSPSTLLSNPNGYFRKLAMENGAITESSSATAVGSFTEITPAD